MPNPEINYRIFNERFLQQKIKMGVRMQPGADLERPCSGISEEGRIAWHLKLPQP
jgi:hypothetical protein